MFIFSPVIFALSREEGAHIGSALSTLTTLYLLQCFPGGSVGKESSRNAEDARDTGSISGSGRPPGGGHGNPSKYSCLENPKDRGAWRAAAHRVAKSRTGLK